MTAQILYEKIVINSIYFWDKFWFHRFNIRDCFLEIDGDLFQFRVHDDCDDQFAQFKTYQVFSGSRELSEAEIDALNVKIDTVIATGKAREARQEVIGDRRIVSAPEPIRQLLRSFEM